MSAEALAQEIMKEFKPDALNSEFPVQDGSQKEIVSVDGQEPNGSFAGMMNEHSRSFTAQAELNPKVSPIYEARRSSGTLSVEEARNLSASLNEFRNRQAGQLEGIIAKINMGEISLGTPISKQLELKMQNLDRQLNTLSTNFNLPEVDTSTASEFEQLLSVGDKDSFKPLQTFLSFVTRGEEQLFSIEHEISKVFADGTDIPNPASILSLQLKMTHVSQQLELFTSTLNKGLESSKTVFNTQI